MKKVILSLLTFSVFHLTFAQFTTSGSDLYHTGGNVGIGTTFPSHILTLKGADNYLKFFDSSGNPRFSLTRSVQGFHYDVLSGPTGAEGYLMHSFRTYDPTNTTLEDRLTIVKNGNVGIGTTSPFVKLHLTDSNINLDGTVGQYGGNLLIATDDSQGADIGGSIAFGGRYANNSALWTFASIKGAKDDNALGQGTGYMTFYTQKSGYSRERMRITSSGEIGIGTNSPSSRLEVSGSISLGQSSDLSAGRITNHTNGFLYFMGGASGAVLSDDSGQNTARVVDGVSGYFSVETSNGTERLRINSAGNAIFYGNIESTKVKVTQDPGNWPDYVFSPNFELRSLDEVEAFIEKNQHLPEVPSAQEIEANGLDLGSMDATLLKKVEELTLYMIEQNKRLKQLETKNHELEKELEMIKKNK